WRLFNRIYVNRVSKASRPTDVRAILANTPTIEHIPFKDGKHREALGQDAIDFIKAAHPDFILRFGFGILAGEVLRCAKYGVWSYHHGDPSEFRGQPPGFWEMVTKSPVTGAVLQVLSDELDGGGVLHRGYFKTILHSYPKTRDALYLGT